VFDTLSDKLQGALSDLRGRGVLDEEAVSRAMREVRLALLEADVNLEIVREFVAHVRERALGQDVAKSLTPGQQVVKIVHEELTALMGSGSSQLAFSQRPPTTILLAGLQGSGKTTAAGKLALLLQKDGRKPALVAADLQRPAAIDQLVQLGAQVGVPVYADERSAVVAASPEALWQVIEGIGGDSGWYSLPAAWALRGLLDRLAGGAGLRRGDASGRLGAAARDHRAVLLLSLGLGRGPLRGSAGQRGAGRAAAHHHGTRQLPPGGQLRAEGAR